MRPKFHQYYLLFISLCVILSSFIGSCDKVIYWDEGFSWTIITSDTLHTCLLALANASDGAPPLWYILMRTLFYFFDENITIARIQSAVFIVLAMYLTYYLLLSFFDKTIAAIGSSYTVCMSPIILFQLSEIRFYGLLYTITLTSCVISYLALSRHRCYPLIIANSIISACCIWVHPFGFIYNVAVFSSFVIHQHIHKSIDSRMIFSFILGWLTFIIWTPYYYHQYEQTLPRFWTSTPNIFEFLQVHLLLFIGNNYIYILLLVLITISISISQGKHFNILLIPRDLTHKKPPSRFFLLLIILSFSLIPTVIYIVSQFKTSLFVARYFIPSHLATSFIFCVLLHIYHVVTKNFKSRYTLLCLGIFIIIMPIQLITSSVIFLYDFNISNKKQQERLISLANQYNATIVHNSIMHYFTTYYYIEQNKLNNKVILVIDQESFYDPREISGWTTLYNLSSTIKQQYPKYSIIETSKHLLDKGNFIGFHFNSIWYKQVITNSRAILNKDGFIIYSL